jgi:multidrug efflux system outer membrane protein
MTNRKLIMAMCAGLTLAGCEMAPKYVRPALPVPPATATGPAYAAASGQEAIVPADVAWTDFFTDDRLRTVIRTALDNNRDLRVAAANVEQARAQYRVQRADLFPTLGANAGATYEKTPLAAFGLTPGEAGGAPSSVRLDTYSANVGVSAWEVDLFGRVRDLSRAAQEQYFAAAENRNAAQTALIAEVGTAWLTMAADQERLKIASDTLIAFGQTLDLTRARFASGISSELDVRQAKTSYDQARADIANATTLVAQDRNALNLLAGTTVDAALLPSGLPGKGATLDSLPANLPSRVLLRRPDIVAAEHQLLGANANIGAARAAFFPNISLTAAFGSLSLGLSSLFGSGSQSWSVAPTASLPIFDFGKNKGNLRYAEATRTAIVAQYERAVQSAFREVADALARRGTIDAQVEAQTSLRDNANGAYRLSDARFRAGIDPFLTTLDSQRTLYTAEQGLIASRLTREANSVELYRALGGGLR